MEGKILTTDNLREREIIIPDWGGMCKSNGEAIDHFFCILMCLENYGSSSPGLDSDLLAIMDSLYLG